MVGSSIAVNEQLSVGRAETQVEVQAEALALQTEDASFKQTIDEKAVTEMPLNGRQMTDLITLAGGSNTAPGNDFTGSKYSYQTMAHQWYWGRIAAAAGRFYEAVSLLADLTQTWETHYSTPNSVLVVTITSGRSSKL